VSVRSTVGWTWRSPRLLEAVAIIVLFAGVAVLATWPLAAHFQSRILGPGGGDQLGYLFDFRYAAENGLPLLRDYVQEYVHAPFGRPASATANLTLLTTLAPAVVISKAAGPIVAYNALTLAGLALSGIAMYALIRWLGLGWGPALWAGLGYTLFPYHLHAASSYVNLVPYWVFPPLIMALVAWAVRPSFRSGVAIVVLVGVALLTFIYFGAMAAMLAGVGLLVALYLHTAREGARRALLRLSTVVGGFIALVVAPIGAIFLANRDGTSGGLQRSPDEARELSARLTDFVIPDRTDRLLTGIVGPDWYAHGSVGGERLAFIGWVTLALCAVGVVLGIRHRRRLAPRIWAALLIGIPALIVLVLSSLRSPYPIAGLEIPTLSGVIFEVFPYMRAFGRFVIVVIAVALMLGAIGLHLLVRRRGTLGKVALVAAALVLSSTEFADGLPLSSTVPSLIEGRSAEEQSTWAWLRSHKDGGIVYEYPDLGNSFIERYYMHGLFTHRHPVANAVTNPGDPGGEFLREIVDIRSRGTAELLAAAGVRYVTLNPWAFRAFNMEQPADPLPGFARAARFPDNSEVWRVTAPAADGVVTFGRGFDVQRMERGRNWRWLVAPGEVVAYPRHPGAYEARFRASAPAGRRTITVTSEDGFSDSATIDGEAEVSVMVHLDGRGSSLAISAHPAPSAAEVRVVEMTPWLLHQTTS
jgi:hypothetical protein